MGFLHKMNGALAILLFANLIFLGAAVDDKDTKADGVAKSGCSVKHDGNELIGQDSVRPELTTRLLDTETSKTLVSLESTDAEISLAESYSYITLVSGGSNTKINLAEKFKTYEDNEISSTLVFKVKVECKTNKTDDQTFEFRQPIEDTNNKKPEFSLAKYELSLPMPVSKGFDLASLENHVSAVDKDLTSPNNKIEFSFKEVKGIAENFEISSVKNETSTKSQYFAKIVAKGFMNLEKDEEMTIVATDGGTPANKVEVVVTLKVDAGNSIPRFEKTAYSANLSELTYTVGKLLEVQFKENLTLERGYSMTGLKLSLLADSEDKLKFFDTPTLDSNRVSVHMKNLTKEFLAEKTIALTLVAKAGFVQDKTTLNIVLPEKIQDAPVPTEAPPAVTEGGFFSGAAFKTIMVLLLLVLLGVAGYYIYTKYYRRMY